MQAEETIKPKQKAIYENMIRSVRRGNSFADTMKDQGDAFPELLINMFRAAQESGRMDQTALRMAEQALSQIAADRLKKLQSAVPLF